MTELFKLENNEEHDLAAFEGYLKTILNDPELYSEVVNKFFNFHQAFQMIPHVCSFIASNQGVIQRASNRFVSKHITQMLKPSDLESLVEEEQKQELGSTASHQSKNF